VRNDRISARAVADEHVREIGVLGDGANHDIAIGDHAADLGIFPDRQDPNVRSAKRLPRHLIDGAQSLCQSWN